MNEPTTYPADHMAVRNIGALTLTLALEKHVRITLTSDRSLLLDARYYNETGDVMLMRSDGWHALTATRATWHSSLTQACAAARGYLAHI